jgi:hypothetical protein
VGPMDSFCGKHGQALHVTEFSAFDETKRKTLHCLCCTDRSGCFLQECEADSFAISFEMGCSDAAARPTVGWAGGCDSRYIVLMPEASCAPRFCTSLRVRFVVCPQN